MSWLTELFCRHKYEKISEKNIPSEVDLVRSYGYKPNHYHSTVRQYVTILTCEKCGKLKTIILKTEAG